MNLRSFQIQNENLLLISLELGMDLLLSPELII
jgi:hypothetical protein